MQAKITQAVILSAGFGTRIKSLFPDVPKVMVPMLGKPILEWHIERLRDHGVKEIFINLHYLPEVITNYFGDGSKWNIKITYATEAPDILGTAGGMKNFDGLLHDNFFLIYGDIFNLLDYTKMAEAFAMHPEAIGMTIVGVNDHPHDSDLVAVDDDLKFVKVYPRPNIELPAHWRTMRALFIFNEKILKYIPATQYYEIDRDLLPDVLQKGETLYGYETKDFLKDIGTPERYKQVEEYLGQSPR
jgi:mannose-1-phosphate guanylyltransferase